MRSVFSPEPVLSSPTKVKTKMPWNAFSLSSRPSEGLLDLNIKLSDRPLKNIFAWLACTWLSCNIIFSFLCRVTSQWSITSCFKPNDLLVLAFGFRKITNKTLKKLKRSWIHWFDLLILAGLGVLWSVLTVTRYPLWKKHYWSTWTKLAHGQQQEILSVDFNLISGRPTSVSRWCII